MRKNLIVIGVLSLVVLTLGLTGFAFAQGQPPVQGDYPYGAEMMGGYHGYGYGMMDSRYGMMGWNGGEGPMHESMIESLAEELNLSPQELESRHDEGETFWDIARSEGLTDEEIRQLMFSVHDAAEEKAISNGWFTPEQADWMDEHMNQAWNGDFSHCADGTEFGVGNGWEGMSW